MINSKSSSPATLKLKKILKLRQPAEEYAGYLDPPYKPLNNTLLDEISKNFSQLSVLDIGEVVYLSSYVSSHFETFAIIIYYNSNKKLMAQTAYYEHWDSPHNSCLQEQTRLEILTLIREFQEKKSATSG